MTSPAYDAVIAGARAAGAATALLLARAGARVLLVDRAPEIGDTLSTHALMRPAVELLASWGLLDPLRRAGTPWVRHARFQYGPDGTVVPIRPTDAAPGLIAPRRRLLDSLLLGAAADAGAEVRLGAIAEDCLRDDSGRVTGIMLREQRSHYPIRAGLVIGADGRASRIAAAVGAATLAVSPHRTSTLYTYVPGITNEGYRWFFGDGVTAGAIPTNDDLHCVFAACRPAEYGARFADPRAGMATVFTRFDPALAAQVSGGAAERIRRFPGAPGHLRARAGDGWALVGDAAFFKDPATAHGITDALLDAHALAAFLSQDGGLTAYHCERDAQSRRIFDTTQRIASLDWSPYELRMLHERLNACIRDEHAATMPRLAPAG
jgi:2-polyprenyl-6-methoxyphenol hydroxylase-like FAD-dependent oxidoreductase